jgi:hypothetical protein
MGAVKSCLAVFGLSCFLMIGSCMFGLQTISSAMFHRDTSASGDSKEFEYWLGERTDTVRTAMYYFLDSSTYDNVGQPVRVDQMSDGSVRLLSGATAPYDLTIDVKLVALNAGQSTKAIVHYDGTRLANKLPGYLSENDFQRALKQELERGLHEIERKKGVSENFLISKVVEKANGTAYYASSRHRNW